MTPLMPISVKLPEETLAKIKRVEALLGYSRNQVILQVVNQTLAMLDHPGNECVPKIIDMALYAEKIENRPRRLRRNGKYGSHATRRRI